MGYWTDPSPLSGKAGAILNDGDKQVDYDVSLFLKEGDVLVMQVDLSVPAISFTNKGTGVTHTLSLA